MLKAVGKGAAQAWEGLLTIGVLGWETVPQHWDGTCNPHSQLYMIV